MKRLVTDRRGVSSLEAVVVIPLVVMTTAVLFSAYDAMSSRRAIEYGLERALRHVAVRSATASAASITAAYRTAATTLSSDVGTNSVVVVTPASGYQPGATVQVAVTFKWTPTAGQVGFDAIQMNRTASVTVVN